MAQELGRLAEFRWDDENLSDYGREEEGAQVIGEESANESEPKFQASAACRNVQQINGDTGHAKHRHSHELKYRGLQKCTKCFSCRIR